jgi:putative endonuclease
MTTFPALQDCGNIRRHAKKLILIGTINPEFKDLVETWGWKTIAAHEKMYP